MRSASASFWSSGRATLNPGRRAEEGHEAIASSAGMWLHPVGNFAQVSAIVPDPLLLVAIAEFIHQRSLAFWLPPVHDITAGGVARVPGISMWAHRGDLTICAPSVNADRITGDSSSVQFLDDGVISSYSVAVRPYFQPLPISAPYRVLWASVDVCTESITSKWKLFYLLEEIHLSSGHICLLKQGYSGAIHYYHGLIVKM